MPVRDSQALPLAPPMPDHTVRRRPVPDDPRLTGYDYADCFEVTLATPDTHSAETWVRTSLEANAFVRRLITVVHAHVLRFDLGPADEHHVLGWRIVTSEPDVLQL